MVLFKNLTDASQIMALAHQMYPRRTQFFLEAFARATARPHGYIFPGEEQKAYVESKKGCYIPFLVTLASDAGGITWSLRACKSTAVI
jgi:hypothetical protein